MPFFMNVTKASKLMIMHNADVYVCECHRRECSCALNVENHVFFLNMRKIYSLFLSGKSKYLILWICPRHSRP